MIPIKTQYKNHNKEFLAIIKVFKSWKYYLKDYIYKIVIQIDYNNCHQFINIKNLNFIFVC